MRRPDINVFRIRCLQLADASLTWARLPNTVQLVNACMDIVLSVGKREAKWVLIRENTALVVSFAGGCFFGALLYYKVRYSLPSPQF